MSMRLTAVVVEALDAQAQARFWARTLQWQLAESNTLDPQVAIHPADTGSIGLVFVPSIRRRRTRTGCTSISPEAPVKRVRCADCSPSAPHQ